MHLAPRWCRLPFDERRNSHAHAACTEHPRDLACTDPATGCVGTRLAPACADPLLRGVHEYSLEIGSHGDRTAEDVQADVRDLFSLALDPVDTEPLLPDILHVAVACDIPVYDATYVGTAQARGFPLLPADVRLWRGGTVGKGRSSSCLTLNRMIFCPRHTCNIEPS